MSPSGIRTRSLLYFALGQAGWFACVLSASRGMQWVGVGIVIVLLFAHLCTVRSPRREAVLISAVALIGAGWESVLVLVGLLAYPHTSSELAHAPAWIIALWALFAGQLNVAYRWLKERLGWATLLGALAGPLSFRAGAALHAVSLEQGVWTLLSLAMGWAVLLPVAVALGRHWDGVAAD